LESGKPSDVSQTFHWGALKQSQLVVALVVDSLRCIRSALRGVISEDH
jgi:hypothetical protein